MTNSTPPAAQAATVDLSHTDALALCEIFIAEMQVRRERLRQLLHMVTIEVDRHHRATAPRAKRKRCNVSAKISA